MFRKIKIWIAFRLYIRARATYEKNPCLANLGRMATANNNWYFLKYPDVIRPAF